MSDKPSYTDPDTYANLTAFEGGYRDLWWAPDHLALMAHRWHLGEREAVLDVGCGAGHWGLTVLPHMAPKAKLTGVDHEAVFLDMARERAASVGLGERAEFALGSVEQLPFPDGSFDVVTCQLVLIHVKEVPLALGEMARVLKPGGVLICCEPDNLAGRVATLASSVDTPDEDTLAIVDLLIRCQRGKNQLGEGDERIGARLPGLLAQAGLTRVQSRTNETTLQLIPPYDDARMQAVLGEEVPWAKSGITVIGWARDDARRHYLASGGGDEAGFDSRWAALERWRVAFLQGTEAGSFSAARGYMMYVVSGAKPMPL